MAKCGFSDTAKLQTTAKDAIESNGKKDVKQ
jgi:hypothetical protein